MRGVTSESHSPLTPEEALRALLVVKPGDEPDQRPVQERIRSAVRLREAGDVATAYALLEPIWSQVEHGDPFDRLFFAHSFADVQASPKEELHWDRVALDTLSLVTEERAAEQGVPGGIAGLRPSLHLNLAYSYAKLGDMDAAGWHYRMGLEDVDVLDDEAYGRGIRQAFGDFAAEYPDGV